MLKHLQKLLLIAALCVPWVTQAQISCDGNPPDTVANGTGTSTTTYFPGYSLYNYSYSEVIIPASTLSNYLTNEFKGLMFNPTVTTAGSYFTNCTIYLANTTVNSLSSGFIDDPATFEMVFTGDLSYTSTGWQTVEFDDSFMWDGSSNIVVAVVRSHGTYSSGATFAAYSASGTLGRYCYRDSPGPFVIGSINNSGASSGSTSTVPQYKLLGCEGEPPTCFKVRNLTVLDINSTGATISWIDTLNSSASYTIYNMEDTSVVASNLTDTFYTFANLTPNTQYRFGIEVDCGGGDVVGYSYVSLRTTCAPINELPYFNDFESDPHYSGTPYADAFPSCWTRINDATGSYNYYPYLYAYPTYAHSGTTGMYWYQTSSSGYAQNEYAVLPPIDLTVYSISDLTLSFYARTTGSTYHPAPIVGVMTNPDDTSTFTPVYTFPANAITTDWQLFVIPLTDYTGTGNLIAIKWPNPSTGSYMAIDDIYLTDEWCDVPGQISIEHGLTEITLSWESNGGSSFTVFLGNDTVSAITDTFYTFNNLTPNTAYNYGVAAECTNGLSMFIGGSLTTLCTPLDSLPYVQTFESAPSGGSNYTTFVECMFRLNNGTNYFGYPYVSSSASYNHTPGGSKGLYWYNTTTTVTYGDYQYVIMPGIDSDYIALDTLQLKFWAKSSSSSYFPEFQVGVMTNPFDANTFELIGNIAVGNSTEWQEFITPLGSYEGYGHYIALRALRPSSSWYAYVDDITIEPVPHCPPIVDLEVTGTTTQYARIQWGYMSGVIEDEPDGYDIVLYEDGSANAPSTFTSTDPYYVFSGLTPGTAYKAFVRVNCGDEVGVADSIVFNTASFGCAVADPDAADTVNFSNSTTGISGCLAYSSWGNTAYQAIYTADELIAAGLAPGPISGIDLGFTSSTYAKEFTIFMGNTSTTSINNATLEDPNQFVQVYGPAAHPTGTSGWQHYDFTTPFVWDGTSSIILTTFMNQPTGQSQTSSSGLTGYYVSANNKARYRYKDSNPFTLNDYNSGNSGSTYSYRASIHFYSFECLTASTCAAPAVWASNVTRDSIYLEWLPGADESSWTVYMDTVLLGTTTSTDFAVGGLTGFTEYTFNVVNDCGDETYVGTVTVTTLPDDAWNTLPVACTFDSTDMDGVWIRVNDNQINKWTIGMAGDSRALMISDDGVNNTYNISSISASHAYMRIVLPAGEYAYSFDWRAYGESSLDYLLAYVVPDSYNPMAGSYSIPGNAIRIDGGSYLNQQGTWQTRSDVFNITDSGTYKIVFTWRNDGSVGTMPPAAIDNFQLALNTCPRPTSIVLDSVTQTSVTFHWVDNSAATTGGYKIEYNGTVDYTIDTTYTATNLNPSTSYTFYVYSACSNDDTSLAITLNAFTDCGDAQVPYFEDFEAYTASSSTFPQCWTNFSNTSNYIQATYGVNSSNALHFAGPGVVVTPRVAIEGNRILLSCWLRAESTTSSGSMHIGFTTDPTTLSDYVEITEIQPTTTLTYYTDIYFDSATADTGYVVFKQDPSASTIYYWWLDELSILDMGTCPRPNNLSATNATQNSVDLSWNDRGTPVSWVIEYGPTGFTLGTGTTVAASTNPFTLTGIPASFQGEFYVRAVCGGGDSSEYCTAPGRFATTQIPATLPYDYNFENDAEWANWQVSSNVATNWYRGNAVASSGSYSLYVSADSGATYKPYQYNAVVNAAAYRDVDFGNVQSSFEISFDARVGGTESNSYDGLMVFLVDPLIPTEASSANITSPWGNVNDLYTITTVRLDTTWQTYSASFDTISGIKRVAFFWFNQNTGTSYGTVRLEPAAVDNIHIEESACPRPVATTVDNVGSTNASLSWYGPASANYEVIYRPYPGGTNTFVQTNTNSIVLTGLDPMTQYAVWVRKICGTDTSLTSDGILFNTEMCDNATTVTNFDTTMSTAASSYSPIGYSTYNYSYTQTIIDSAQLVGLADAGDITAMGFSPASTTAGDYFTNITVYLANLPDSLGDLSSSFIHPSADLPFVKVIDSADFSYTTTSLQLHGFDTAFTWDGTSRILVSVVRNHGAWTSGSSFNAHTQTSGHMRYVYNDNAPYDYTTVSGGTASTTVGDIYLISCGAGCAKPTLSTVSNLSYDGATLNWVSNATEFEVAVKAATDAEYPTATPVSNATSFSVTGLAPATMYRYHVRAICDEAEGLISDWAEGTFTTDSLPCFDPTELAVQATGYTTVTLGWTANGEETNWRIHVWNTAFDTTYDVNSNPATVGGLAPDVDYSAEVMALCGAVMLESGVSNTVTFHTAQCEVPTGVTVSNVTAHTAVVSWTGNAQSYRVTYGYEGFGTGNEIAAIPVTGTTTTLTGLESGETYDVYVYAVCETGIESNASTKTTFETDIEGISTADGMNVSIYPNPTTDATTIALSGVNGEVSITIVDMNGRIVKSDSMSCEGDCTKRMEVNGLAQGAYFVRINGEGLNMVKKLVVK